MSPRLHHLLLAAVALATLALAHGAETTSAKAPSDDVLAHLQPGHPRLLCTDEQLAAAVAAAKTDPLRAQLHARIIAAAEAQLNTAPIEHVLIGPRLLDKSRTCVARVLTCAMAYRLTHDDRFAARAKKEMLTAAAFADWNPSHFLDVAEMSLALGVGYDWLYEQLSPTDRHAIKQALLEKSLVFAPMAYAPGGPTDKRVWFATARHNWNQVCNGGLLAAALALADEEPALAALVVRGARQSLPLAMEAYQPDGAYPEGPGYWTYGTTYNVIAIAELQTALGSDFGLTAAPAFLATAAYRVQVEGPTGQLFNYADGGAGHSSSPALTWLALQAGREGAAVAAFSRKQLQGDVASRRSDSETSRFGALWVPWFPAAPAAGAAEPEALPLDARFRGRAEIAVFRSAWNDPRALFVGFKAGRNDVNHAHLDLGSFVLEADGVRWVQDLGPDDYNLPAYFGAKRWTYYRLNNHSHNTVTPGNALQDPKAVAPIVAYHSTPARAYAVADLTATYPGAARKITRGVAVLDRARLLVQDDLIGVKPGSALTSRVVTGARVTIDDPHHATLTQSGQRLRIEILAPAEAKFSMGAARPSTKAERQNDGVTALTAELVAPATDVRIALLLTPVGDRWPSLPAPALTAVDRW